MNAAGKSFVKTCLKAVRCTVFPNIWYFYPTEGESLAFRLGGRLPPSPPKFPCSLRRPDLSTRKTPRVVGLLTVMIFFQSKSFKVKDEKEETIFYFLMVFNLLKIIHPFESKKHLRTQWNLNFNTQEYLMLLIGFGTNSYLQLHNLV